MKTTLLIKAGLIFAFSFPPHASHAQSNPATERAITAYFNQRANQQFTEPYRGITRNGDDFERVIIKQIARARSSIDVAVMGLTLPNIARALVDAKQRGVMVRVVMDNDYNRNWIDLSIDEVADLSDEEQEIGPKSIRLLTSAATAKFRTKNARPAMCPRCLRKRTFL